MTTTPDGISFADLQDFIKDAPKEEEVQKKAEALYDDKTANELIDIVNRHLNEITEEVNHPLSHKVAVMEIVTNMIDWHTTIANKMIDEGETDSAIAWARDAGKFQSIMNILVTIAIGNDDFTHIEN
jgi:hypothetical protein